MCQRSMFSRSCSRLAEEVQLRAEEEFIVNALKIIKHQRNCLQIERLHLESLKQQLMKPVDSTEATAQGQSKESTNPTKSKPTEMMSAVDMMTLGAMQRKDQDANMDDDMQCNKEELNLNLDATASGASTSQPAYGRYDYEYDSEEEESEVSDEDDVVIDMNMLMNGSAARD